MFSRGSGTTQPRDYLTREERTRIREAALEYGSVPGYNDLSPEARDRWKAYLAQRLEKPKSEVVPADWGRVNGWKISSLTWASLDTGLRPIEVERAVTDWVDVDNSVLRIPKEQSAKVRGNWTVSLQERTADMLDRWLDQRDTRAKYDDADALWLTREGNPYGSSALIYVLGRLCDIAGIETGPQDELILHPPLDRDVHDPRGGSGGRTGPAPPPVATDDDEVRSDPARGSPGRARSDGLNGSTESSPSR
jgi:integrase